MREFDNNNPWHVGADFMFGFYCEKCENQINLDDVESEDFSEQCVEMAEIAIKMGGYVWMILFLSVRTVQIKINIHS